MYGGEGMKEQINSFLGSSAAPFRMTYPSYLYKDELLLLFFQLTTTTKKSNLSKLSIRLSLHPVKMASLIKRS